MKKLLFLIFMILPAIGVSADNVGWQMDWNAGTRFAGSSGQYMPFWSRTGEDGILPVRSSWLVTVGSDLSYRHRNGIYFDAGVNLAGAVAQKSPVSSKNVYGMLDRLYVGGGWKMLHLDIGMRPRQRELSDVSISGGNFMYSRNTRNMPGINAWSDWIYFEKGHWVGIKGNIAHYQTIDNRYVRGAMIHNKSLAFKFAFGPKVDATIGLDHWAQWGGDSPLVDSPQTSFMDYLRIFLGQEGGDGATLSDRVNVLGNHLGREVLRIDWKHSKFTMSVQYDKPYEDGSGLKYRNSPDGIWSLQFLFKDRNAWVTDLVLEYIGTTWQTGPRHDRPATEEEKANQDPNDHYYGKIVLGGCDNYFGNSEYRSGWTYYGRTIGLPLIIPAMPDENGVTMDIVSTRLRGCHLGLKGVISKKVPYSFKATYSMNYGKYNSSHESFKAAPWQLSMALEAGVDRRIIRLPMSVSLGIYGDIGQLYHNSIGLTLKIAYNDFFRF